VPVERRKCPIALTATRCSTRSERSPRRSGRCQAARASARLRNELAGLGALAAVGIVWTAWAMGRSDFNAPGAQPLLDVLPAYLDTFAIGMGLAVLSVRLLEREVAPAVIQVVDRRPGVAWMTAFALWGLSIWVAPDPGYTPMTRVQYLAKHLLLGLAAAAVLLPAIVGDPARGAVRKLLGNRVLLWLGLISYGVYLYHQPAYALLARAPDLAGGHPVVDVGMRVVAAFAMSVALAALSYYLMERPVMRLRRLFEGPAPRRQDQPGAASVPVTPQRAPERAG
jgi:peptidoglycan/LPS O-acetylase OafA/YrhL